MARRLHRGNSIADHASLAPRASSRRSISSRRHILPISIAERKFAALGQQHGGCVTLKADVWRCGSGG
jgi:hypothetical protein